MWARREPASDGRPSCAGCMKTIHNSVQSKPSLAIGLTDQQICVNSKFLLYKLQHRLIKDEKIKESNVCRYEFWIFPRRAAVKDDASETRNLSKHWQLTSFRKKISIWLTRDWHRVIPDSGLPWTRLIGRDGVLEGVLPREQGHDGRGSGQDVDAAIQGRSQLSRVDQNPKDHHRATVTSGQPKDVSGWLELQPQAGTFSQSLPIFITSTL